MLRHIFIQGAVLAVTAATCGAQSTRLPPTSRTVYRCEVEKKVVYSDEPCLGAKRINVEPTRGLDQTSGKKQSGNDIRNEHNREAFANALKPLTGLDDAHLQKRVRRNKLSLGDQTECKSLDERIPDAEMRAKAAGAETLMTVKQELLAMRQHQRKLGC